MFLLNEYDQNFLNFVLFHGIQYYISLLCGDWWEILKANIELYDVRWVLDQKLKTHLMILEKFGLDLWMDFILIVIKKLIKLMVMR